MKNAPHDHPKASSSIPASALALGGFSMPLTHPGVAAGVNTGAWVLFFVAAAVLIGTAVAIFTKVNEELSERLPGWAIVAALVVGVVLLGAWVVNHQVVLVAVVLAGCFGFWAFHLLRIATKPGIKLADALDHETSRERREDARDFGETSPEEEQAESQERGSALDHVLDEAIEERGDDVEQT